jgi:hypothetical protein
MTSKTNAPATAAEARALADRLAREEAERAQRIAKARQDARHAKCLELMKQYIDGTLRDARDAADQAYTEATSTTDFGQVMTAYGAQVIAHHAHRTALNHLVLETWYAAGRPMDTRVVNASPPPDYVRPMIDPVKRPDSVGIAYALESIVFSAAYTAAAEAKAHINTELKAAEDAAEATIN